jgi:lipopolysaccharide/colanic/teichoic acid biosynthesis glycosyltransferase
MTARPGWYPRWGKRVIDLVLTTASIPVTAPLGALGWLAARWATGEPGLFTQDRIGLNGETFLIWKLRTMRPARPEEDASHRLGVTAGATARITRTGRWLRRTKLDELPQLRNVLAGDMSLVGPRPDVPEWLELLRRHPDALAVRPGLTSLASLAYADEEEVLAREVDPVAAYAEVVLPHKLALNELYARNLSPTLDFIVLALTAVSIVSRRTAQRGARAMITALGGSADYVPFDSNQATVASKPARKVTGSTSGNRLRNLP